MKKLIKRWLGITTLEEVIEKLEKEIKKKEIPTDLELQHLVGLAVMDALDGKNDTGSRWGWNCGFQNTVTRALENAAHDSAVRAAKEEIKNTIDTEVFIDKVVARINTKQV